MKADTRRFFRLYEYRRHRRQVCRYAFEWGKTGIYAKFALSTISLASAHASRMAKNSELLAPAPRPLFSDRIG